MNLDQYRKRLNANLTKEGLFEEIDLAKSILSMTQGAYPKWSESIESLPKDYPELATPKYINHMAKTCTKKNLARSLKACVVKVNGNIDTLHKTVTTEFPDDFSPMGANARQLNILLTIEVLTTFASNLTFLIIQCFRASVRVENPEDEDYATNNIAMKKMASGRDLLVTCIDIMQKSTSEFSKVLSGVPDVVVTAANQSLLESKLSQTGGYLKAPKPKGFNGSPILWIRQSFMGLFEDRYNELDDEKRYLELLLIQAENKKMDRSSPAIQAEIDRIEERIVSLDYRMNKILEESGNE